MRVTQETELKKISPLRLRPFRLAVSFLIRTMGEEQAMKVSPDQIVEALMQIREEHPGYKDYFDVWWDKWMTDEKK